MVDRTKGLASLDIKDATRLRWVLRDIKGGRLRFSPASPDDIQTLVAMGYVEIEDEKPRLTAAGLREVD